MNQAIYDDYDKIFFNGDGEKIIENCFKSVLVQHKDNDFHIPPAFRAIVENMCGL